MALTKTREREKNSEIEPCFTVIVLSFARETKDKLCSLKLSGPRRQNESLKRERCEIPLSLFPSACG